MVMCQNDMCAVVAAVVRRADTGAGCPAYAFHLWDLCMEQVEGQQEAISTVSGGVLRSEMNSFVDGLSDRREVCADNVVVERVPGLQDGPCSQAFKLMRR